MAGVEYNVAAILSGKDQGLETKLHAAGKAADKASRSLEAAKGVATAAAGAIGKAGDIVGGAIDGLVSFAAKGVATLGAAGIGAAMLGLKVGIVDVNAKLEDTEIGFTTLFHTIGGSDMNDSLEQARQIMGEIRKDAKDLPGEFGDFVGMAQTLTAPLLNAGKGVEDIRNLTRDTVVVAASLGVRFDQAGREMAMLLEGHAGGHNVLGTRLGITTHTQVNGKEFNKASAAERMDFITKKLGPAKDSLDLFSKSWGGLTSTLMDTGKQFLGNATSGIFGAAKKDMISLIQWTGRHEDQINVLARHIGYKLVDAYDVVRGKALWFADHWDVVNDKIDAFRGRLLAAWHEIEPLARRAALFLEHEASNPERMAKHLLLARAGAGAASAAPGLLSGGLQLGAFMRGSGGVAEAVEKGVAKGIAAQGGGLFGEAGALEASLGGNALLADSLGGGGAAAAGGVGAGAVAFAALAAAAVMAVAAVDNVSGSLSILSALGTDTWSTLSHLFEAIAGPGTAIREIIGGIGAVMIRAVDNNIRPMLTVLDALSTGLDHLNQGWNALWVTLQPFDPEKKAGEVDLLKESLDYLGIALTSVINPLGGFVALVKKLSGDKSPDDSFVPGAEAPLDRSTTTPSTAYITGGDFKPKGKSNATTKPPVVNAQGSHITIQLNLKDSDPDRIIRRVFTRMGDVLAKPIAAPFAPPPGGH